MDNDQPSFTDIEYGNRRRVSRRERFLETMDATIPWQVWVGLIEPFYFDGKRGRKPKALQTMLRMYLLQVWFSLSDEGVEEAIYDSYAMRRFMGLDFAVEQVPDATTLLHFRHLLEAHELGEKLFEAQNEIFDVQGWIMRGGSIVDATIIAAPSSTKNASGARDPQMRQTKKGNQWYFGMKAHIGVDAGTGYVHSLTVTAASVHDLDEVTDLIRADDGVVYADAGYQGVQKRPEVAEDEHLAGVEFRVAARKGKLQAMAAPDRAAESRKASVRAKVEHPFLVVKRDCESWSGWSGTGWPRVGTWSSVAGRDSKRDWLLGDALVKICPSGAGGRRLALAHDGDLIRRLSIPSLTVRDVTHHSAAPT